MIPAFLILLAASWPQFLGPRRNLTTTETVSLKNARLVWKKDVGAGFSAPVIDGGKLILFHRVKSKEVVECLDPDSGSRIWAFKYPTLYRDDFGFDEGPRGTPAISGGRVYTFGAEGLLHAIDLPSGKKLWAVDTMTKYGVRKGFFGAAASPLVEGDLVVVNVGGPNRAGIVAFDRETGKQRWSATNDDAGYSSPIAVELGGKRTILCVTRAGLAALDPASGSVRFQFPWRSRSSASVNAAVPVVDRDLIFLSASYGTGATLLDVAGDAVKQVWASDDALSNHYASDVLKDGYLYGFHGRQEYGQALRCIEMKTGKVQWSVEDFGAGTITMAGDRLIVVRENGEAQAAPVSPKGWKPEAKVQLLPAVVRSYPAISGGRMYVRNEHTLACYEVR